MLQPLSTRLRQKNLEIFEKNTGQSLTFNQTTVLDLVCFYDAVWASYVDDQRSTIVQFVFLGGCLVNWCSQKQKVVARSSCEAEYMAVAEVASELTWQTCLRRELEVKVEGPIVLWCDNVGATSLAANPVFHARTKNVEIDVHFVGEKVAAKELEI